MAATSCAECKTPLRVEYELEPLPERCKHRITRMHTGPEPCPLCIASREQLLADWQATNPVCRSCKAKEEEEEARSEERKRLERLTSLSGLPEQLRGLSWDDMIRSGDRRVAIAAAVKWATCEPREARGLYLWGEAGTGKTRLAGTAAWARLSSGMALRWVSVAVLLAKLESSFSDDERQVALGVLTGDGPIVLDDIDKVNPSESKRAQLFAAIDRRVNAGVPMLVTGNLSPARLEQKLDAPIASRILGYALGRTFQMDGPDRRMTLDDAAE